MTKKREEKEYRIINLVMEYGHRLDGCKYAVASALLEEELNKRFKEELLPYEPYLYLTKEMGDAIVESQSNQSKYAKRRVNNEVPTGYSEGDTERLGISAYMAIKSLDPCEILTYEDDPKIVEFRNYLSQLSDKQRQRLEMRFEEKKKYQEIAEIEGVSHVSIWKSISGIVKKVEEIFDLGLQNGTPNSQ